ncbi:portal protein [Synechococcus phage DSL-LC03]|nr:portal protein [Synechococcus phage DSL-LC03]
MAGLFGFSIDDGYKKPKKQVSPVPPNNEDGVDYYISSGFYGQYVDIEGVYKTEYDLIKRYREMSLHPECDKAIEDVVNEAIVADLNDSPVEIELSNLNVPEEIKQLIRSEFKYIKELMDFDKKAHEIFRNWYIDGRVYYHKVIDLDNPQNGIQEIRYIDSLKIKYIREIKKKGNGVIDIQNVNMMAREMGVEKLDHPEVEEYFVYTPKSQGYSTGASGYGKGVKLAKDSVTFVTSGLVDRNKMTILSYLHKAIKSLNQLRMIEDSLVIYRLSRAPERRIFYIDVGNLPKIKAEQYLRDVMSRYRNKLVYDASTGEVRDDKKFTSMMEDFWLPRREGGRGTEITTLPGGQNLGELSDIEYFQKKLYRSLSVPESRIAADGGFNLGRSSEILRDEIMFSRFVGRLRKRFSNIFHDLLKTQLILKNIITPQDWEAMSDHIQYDYVYDNHFAELKQTELMNERIQLLQQVEPYIGKYYSTYYVRSKILRQSEDEILDNDAQIQMEKETGIIPPPAPQYDPATGMPMDYVTDIGSKLVKKTQNQNTKDLEIGLGKGASDPDIKKKGTEIKKAPEADKVKTDKINKL